MSVFSRGYFTPRVNGWYHICAFSRFRNTGNSNDVNVLIVSTVDGRMVGLYNLLLRMTVWWLPTAVPPQRTTGPPESALTR